MAVVTAVLGLHEFAGCAHEPNSVGTSATADIVVPQSELT